jgi:hypothetical protein
MYGLPRKSSKGLAGKGQFSVPHPNLHINFSGFNKSPWKTLMLAQVKDT